MLGPTCAACVAIGRNSWECVQESASGTEVWLSTPALTVIRFHKVEFFRQDGELRNGDEIKR
jgi:hypothetical protein